MTWAQYRRRECTVADAGGAFGFPLSAMETELLSTLILRAGCVVSKDALIEAVYPDPDDEPEWASACIVRAVDRIRRKISKQVIATVWGRGYTIPRESLLG